MSSAAHIDAFSARLREDTVLATATFEGVVQDRPNRYCTIHAAGPTHTAERFNGRSTQQDYSVTVHSVGTTPAQARFVQDRVVAQLLDFTLTVSGRSVRRIRHTYSRPVDIDKDVSPPLWYFVDEFEFTSSPA